MKQIELKLRRAIGLDATSIGSSLIERAVRLRMHERGLEALDRYKRILEAESEEWEKLVESVVVTETWFFRDRGPFDALVRIVREHWLPEHPTAPLRVLSVPCSSGEEPYSIAMALLDASVPPTRFQIDAADLSTQALAHARAGVYGKNSFRGKNLEFRDRYFQKTKEGFVLAPQVRRNVHFHQANLFSPEFLGGRASYDFIFCRNLMIYFDRPTQQIALQKIGGLLASAGVLFVGSAELPLTLEHGFSAVNLPMAFACTRTSDGKTFNRLLQAESKPVPFYLPKSQPGIGSFESPRVENEKTNGALLEIDKTRLDLQRARRLADAGRFEEAAGICEAQLRGKRPSADVYYLLGLLRDSTGDASAIDYYRKALYLQPDHYETLLQMALLSEKEGNRKWARVYRERASRIKRDQGSGSAAKVPASSKS